MVGLIFSYNEVDGRKGKMWPLSEESGVFLRGRRGAGWGTERLGEGLVLVWRRPLRGGWDGSVWRGCRVTDKDRETFTFYHEKRSFMFSRATKWKLRLLRDRCRFSRSGGAIRCWHMAKCSFWNESIQFGQLSSVIFIDSFRLRGSHLFIWTKLMETVYDRK